MKVVSVEVIRLNTGEAPVPGGAWHPTVVRVNTDEGISGLGEVAFSFRASRHSAVAGARDFAEHLIGRNPLNRELIWESLFQDTFWGIGGGGFEFGGLSALDIALWDIHGKALGVPVYELLGGKTNTRLRAYASQIQLDWGGPSRALTAPASYGEAALKAKAEGFTAIKVNPLFFDATGAVERRNHQGMLSYEQVTLAVQRVASIREACGADFGIILELHALTDTNTAIQLGSALDDIGILYMEEPTLPVNTSGMGRIAAAQRIPLAAGERHYGRWGFKRLLEDGSVSVVQPDLGSCGGLTEGKKICDLARTYDASVQLHLCGGPIATAAALHLEAVLPNFLIHEHHAAASKPANRMLCEFDYQPVDGFYEVPERPGIGQELSDEALRHADVFTVS